jgi:hypothetical protein
MRKRIVMSVVLATWSAVALQAQTANSVDTMLPVPPLPQIGLPLPHIGLPPPDEQRKPAQDPQVQPGRGGERRGQRRTPTVVFVPYIIERATAPAATREGPSKSSAEEPAGRPRVEAPPEPQPQPPEPVSPAPAVPAEPAPRIGPVYIIAGCYAGNVPPSQVALPSGCDASKATTLER